MKSILQDQSYIFILLVTSIISFLYSFIEGEFKIIRSLGLGILAYLIYDILFAR